MFNLNYINQPLYLVRNHLWSTMNHTTPPQKEIDGTHAIAKKYNIQTGEELTLLYPKKDTRRRTNFVVLMLSDAFENFVGTSTFDN